MRPRRGLVRQAESSNNWRNHFANARGRRNLFRPGACNQHIARGPLLQQQLRGLHDRLGMKSGFHQTVGEHVGESHQRHALVMGHVGVNDRYFFSFRDARLGVVERFVKTVRAAASLLRDTFQILHRERRFDHRGQRRGVGRDHQVFTQPTLQPQPRYSETGILISEIDVADVERRFRNPPRHSAFRPVLHLPEHHLLVGLVQHAFFRRTHHQGWHQVFEHRTGPGNQRRTAADRRERAAQPKPVRRGNFAFGDGDEAREPSLRRQQIVTTRIQGPVAGPEPDRK